MPGRTSIVGFRYVLPGASMFHTISEREFT